MSINVRIQPHTSEWQGTFLQNHLVIPTLRIMQQSCLFGCNHRSRKTILSSSSNANLKVTVLSKINSTQSNNHYLPEFDGFITHHFSKFPLKMLKWFVIRHITALAVKMTNTSACTQTLNYTVINKDS